MHDVEYTLTQFELYVGSWKIPLALAFCSQILQSSSGGSYSLKSLVGAAIWAVWSDARSVLSAARSVWSAARSVWSAVRSVWSVV